MRLFVFDFDCKVRDDKSDENKTGKNYTKKNQMEWNEEKQRKNFLSNKKEIEKKRKKRIKRIKSEKKLSKQYLVERQLCEYERVSVC